MNLTVRASEPTAGGRKRMTSQLEFQACGDSKRQMRRRTWAALFAWTLAVPLVGCATVDYEAHPYAAGRSDVDIPISLALGTVRTPEFAVVAEYYTIMIQIEKPLPFDRLQCMLGVTDGTALDLRLNGCGQDEPILRADWTVWDESRVVAKGSSTSAGLAMWSKDHIYKFLEIPQCSVAAPRPACGFKGVVDRKYVLEVRFTADGSALNVANPHLIVVRHRYH
jgi:hypothetical protein